MTIGKALALGAALVAALAVATSIWLNPPSENRARAMDMQRLNRLSLIVPAVQAYFTDHKALPASLEALDAEKNRLSHESWHDPESGQPFEYQTTGEKSYRLCANFVRASDAQLPYYGLKHNAGHDCFDHTVR